MQVQLRNIGKAFDDEEVLQNICLTIKNGEKFMLLGESGSGKTTLLRIINRMISQDSGEVLLEGINTSTIDALALKRSIGYVMQHFGLFPHLDLETNISITGKIIGEPLTQRKEKVKNWLSRVGLPESYGSRLPSELSGGQKQRAAFARALYPDNDLILMDEPFGALDPLTRKQLQMDFKSTDLLSGKTVIMVTHDIEEAFSLGDRVALIKQGQVEQVGTAEDFLSSPASAYVKTFVKGLEQAKGGHA